MASSSMDNLKTDHYYLQKIVVNLQFVLLHTEQLTREEICANEVLLDSVMFRLVQISENTTRLSEDFKRKYHEVPWKEIRGLRNRIIHEYGDVDLTIVCDTVKNDLPLLHAQLATLV